MGYDKKIYHSLLTVLATIAIVVIIVVSSYFVIYGANGVTMLKDKDKKPRHTPMQMQTLSTAK